VGKWIFQTTFKSSLVIPMKEQTTWRAGKKKTIYGCGKGNFVFPFYFFSRPQVNYN
jgi:hypothetical protein